MGARDIPKPMNFSSTPKLFVGTMPYYNDSRYSLEDIHKVVLNNLKAGVRHIDTAELYDEILPYVQLAIKDSKIHRHELFICSKIKGLPTGNYDDLKARVLRMLKRLGLDFVDLLLIHWPGHSSADLTQDPDKIASKMSWKYFDSKIEQAWNNMARLQEDGFTKRIGVSNFYRHHLERLQEVPACQKFPPVANQIYLDATQHQTEYVSAMQKAGIQVMSYRSLEFLNAIEMAGQMGDTVHKELLTLMEKCGGKKNFKSLKQFVLTWLFARGVHVCAKSGNVNHVRENVAALKKVKLIPEEIFNQFPSLTELTTMMFAYDQYAKMFEQRS